jgi:hypothetical protein
MLILPILIIILMLEQLPPTKPRNTVKTAGKLTMAFSGVLPQRQYSDEQYGAWLLHRQFSGNFDVFSGGGT